MDGNILKPDAVDGHDTELLQAMFGMGDPFEAAIRATRMSMIITDPHQADNPIVFANDAFLKLTGYARAEILGRNCRFLQGPDTDPVDVEAVREAIAARRDINIDILNYRKDGAPFWNALYISPVSDETGRLRFFFASQLDVSDRKHSEHHVQSEKALFERAVKERTQELEAALEAQKLLMHEVDHRVKNNLQMISSLIVMQSRSIPDEGIRRSLRSMLERVEALSTVHRRLYQARDVTRFDVAEFVRDLVGDLVGGNGRTGIRSRLDIESVEIPAEKAAPIALMINELVTNALKHAFNGRGEGEIAVRLERLDGRLRLEIADDGDGLGPTVAAGDGGPAANGSFGMNLIRSLGRQLRADVRWRDAAPGTRVTVDMPVEPGLPE